MEWARAFSMDLNQVRDMFSDVQSAVSGIHKVEAITALGLYVCLKVFKKSIFVQEVHIHLTPLNLPPFVHIDTCTKMQCTQVFSFMFFFTPLHFFFFRRTCIIPMK